MQRTVSVQLALVVVVAVVGVAALLPLCQAWPAVHWTWPTTAEGEVYHGSPADLQEWLGEEIDFSPEAFPVFRQKLIRKITQWSSEYLDWDISAQGRPTGKEYPYFAFLPPLVAAVVPGAKAETWEGGCFKNTTVSATPNGVGWEVTVELSKPDSISCSDFYLFATMNGVKVANYMTRGTHTFNWTMSADAGSPDVWDTKTNGIRVFRFLDNIPGTIADVLSTVILFGSELTQGVPEIVAEANIDFLKKYTGINMEKRSVQSVPVDESLIQSGDFFGIVRLDGLDPMLAWAMGSTTGHTTVALRINGDLYVTESTAKDSYWPTNGIQKTPYQQWIQQARAAGFQVVWAPLSAEMRAIFNETAAIARFNELEGLNYGYHNMFYGWIDTLVDNYPCIPPNYTQCFQWDHVEILYGITDRLAPNFANLFFSQAINLRLGTSDLNATSAAYYSTEVLGIPFESVPSIVEQDAWNYSTTRYNTTVTDKAMVCCVFVCNMWKAGGLFDSIENEINCAELTNWDDYSMTIFDVTTPRPSQCVQADPNNQLCQLEGEYTLNLNNFASKNMYPHIAETCPSEAPKYIRPPNC